MQSTLICISCRHIFVCLFDIFIFSNRSHFLRVAWSGKECETEHIFKWIRTHAPATPRPTKEPRRKRRPGQEKRSSSARLSLGNAKDEISHICSEKDYIFGVLRLQLFRFPFVSIPLLVTRSRFSSSAAPDKLSHTCLMDIIMSFKICAFFIFVDNSLLVFRSLFSSSPFFRRRLFVSSKFIMAS